MTPTATTVPKAPERAPLRLDFPTWLPPMLVKELRQGLRARGFVGSFMGFQTVMIIAFFYAAVLRGAEAFEAANSMFWSLFTVLLLIVTPLRALAGLGFEIEGRSVDLLVLTQLDASRIVLGKWVSLMAQATLLAAALLPYGVLRYYLGSVDLVSDLGLVAGLMAGCALLSAVALWISGWPKTLRVLFGVAVIPAFIIMQGGAFGLLYAPYTFFVRTFYGARSFGPGGVPPAYMGASVLTLGSTWGSVVVVGVLAFDGLLLVGFSLVQAARRLAPPAENHAAATRALALLTLVPPVVLTLFVSPESGGMHLFLSAVAVTFVCGMELSRVEDPMRVQVRPWLNSRISWRVLSGPFVLPGWPSAALFSAVALALLYGIITFYLLVVPVVMTTPVGASPGLILWWLILAWVGLVFPILLLTCLAGHRRFSIAGYWIVQGLMAILGLISLSGTTEPHARAYVIVLDAVSQILPVSSFWLGWQWVNPEANLLKLTFSLMIFVGQFAVLAGTVALYRARSRPYWRQVWEYSSSRARDPAPPPA